MHVTAKGAPMFYWNRTLTVASATALLAAIGGCDDVAATAPEAATQVATNEDPEPATDLAEPADPNKVLRHAVFFSFKEGSSPDQVDEVVRAFAELPSKVDAIIDFEWGVNNSPEKHDDGFTHCFLLTFRDAAGREAYLPHPAHKAFGDVLRPHMKDVFVIDYWGDANAKAMEKALRHVVFFRFKPGADADKVKQVETAFAALPSKIDAIKAFEWGVNNSPEKHDDGFTHCFLVTFDSEEGRAAYLPHEAHQEFVKLLGPVLEKPRVLDFWAKKSGEAPQAKSDEAP